ncbi:hypothetical protein KX928_15125 [Roseobacter sp. YSTF-M11]|uniref:SCP domain-containing protein n=1 Tax=Roseobacter insulae TaxID=2859783 RepID=A0A9X1K3X6_9RHOB|nr:CAP domain-containing protein [Roseobacter insulae]MBW4709122.1 hypothetical protein [Roseobacter insulae]
MSQANALEQLMLNLINEERAAVGVQPLTFDDRLNDASEDHSSWMLGSNQFSHTGVGGSSPTDRMERAGFEFEGAWRSGENIGWQSERGDPGLEDDVEQIHDSLMRSPGHRANILNPNFDEIGIGIEQGDFTSGSTFDSVMVTQNFATTDADDPAPVDATETPVVTSDMDDSVPDDAVANPVNTAEPAEVPEVTDDDSPVDTVNMPDDGEEPPVDTAETDDTPDADGAGEPVDSVDGDETAETPEEVPVETADTEDPAADDMQDDDTEEGPVDTAGGEDTPADEDADDPAEEDMAACGLEGDGVIFVNFRDVTIDFNFYGIEGENDEAEGLTMVAASDDRDEDEAAADAPELSFDVDAFLAQVSEMLTQIDWQPDCCHCSEMA